MKLFKYFSNVLCSHYGWRIINLVWLECLLPWAMSGEGTLSAVRLSELQEINQFSSPCKILFSRVFLAKRVVWHFSISFPSFRVFFFCLGYGIPSQNFSNAYVRVFDVRNNCRRYGGRDEKGKFDFYEEVRWMKIGIMGFQLFVFDTTAWNRRQKCRCYSVIYRCGAYDWEGNVVSRWKLRWYSHCQLPVCISCLFACGRLGWKFLSAQLSTRSAFATLRCMKLREK